MIITRIKRKKEENAILIKTHTHTHHDMKEIRRLKMKESSTKKKNPRY